MIKLFAFFEHLYLMLGQKTTNVVHFVLGWISWGYQMNCVFMDSLTQLQRSGILSRFEIQKGKGKSTFNFPYDKISVFIVIEALILNFPTTNKKTSLNLGQFIEKYMQGIILIGILRKFNIDLPVNFFHCCFLFSYSFIFLFISFTSLFFVVLWKNRL